MVRLKHRWIVGQILYENTSTGEVTASEIQIALREKIQILFGDVGAGSFGNSTMVRFFDKETSIFVVRTTREACKDVWFAMSCISCIQKLNIIIRVIRVSGSVRTCAKSLEEIFESIISKLIIASMPEDLLSRRSLFLSQIQSLD